MSEKITIHYKADFLYRIFFNKKYKKLKDSVDNLLWLLEGKLNLPSSIYIEFRLLRFDKKQFTKTLGYTDCFKETWPITIIEYSNYKQEIGEMLTTLIHELIHVDQLFTKKLEVKRNGFARKLSWFWEGNEIQKKHIILAKTKEEQTEYENWPWEIAARQKTIELVDFVNKQLNNK